VEANEVIDGGVTRAGFEGAGHVHKAVGKSALRLCRLRHNTAMDDINAAHDEVGGIRVCD
jgi:hypothetical protein